MTLTPLNLKRSRPKLTSTLAASAGTHHAKEAEEAKAETPLSPVAAIPVGDKTPAWSQSTKHQISQFEYEEKLKKQAEFPKPLGTSIPKDSFLQDLLNTASATTWADDDEMDYSHIPVFGDGIGIAAPSPVASIKSTHRESKDSNSNAKRDSHPAPPRRDSDRHHPVLVKPRVQIQQREKSVAKLDAGGAPPPASAAVTAAAKKLPPPPVVNPWTKNTPSTAASANSVPLGSEKLKSPIENGPTRPSPRVANSNLSDALHRDRASTAKSPGFRAGSMIQDPRQQQGFGERQDPHAMQKEKFAEKEWARGETPREWHADSDRGRQQRQPPPPPPLQQPLDPHSHRSSQDFRSAPTDFQDPHWRRSAPPPASQQYNLDRTNRSKSRDFPPQQQYPIDRSNRSTSRGGEFGQQQRYEMDRSNRSTSRGGDFQQQHPYSMDRSNRSTSRGGDVEFIGRERGMSGEMEGSRVRGTSRSSFDSATAGEHAQPSSWRRSAPPPPPIPVPVMDSLAPRPLSALVAATPVSHHPVLIPRRRESIVEEKEEEGGAGGELSWRRKDPVVAPVVVGAGKRGGGGAGRGGVARGGAVEKGGLVGVSEGKKGVGKAMTGGEGKVVVGSPVAAPAVPVGQQASKPMTAAAAPSPGCWSKPMVSSHVATDVVVKEVAAPPPVEADPFPAVDHVWRKDIGAVDLTSQQSSPKELAKEVKDKTGVVVLKNESNAGGVAGKAGVVVESMNHGSGAKRGVGFTPVVRPGGVDSGVAAPPVILKKVVQGGEGGGGEGVGIVGRAAEGVGKPASESAPAAAAGGNGSKPTGSKHLFTPAQHVSNGPQYKSATGGGGVEKQPQSMNLSMSDFDTVMKNIKEMMEKGKAVKVEASGAVVKVEEVEVEVEEVEKGEGEVEEKEEVVKLDSVAPPPPVAPLIVVAPTQPSTPRQQQPLPPPPSHRDPHHPHPQFTHPIPYQQPTPPFVYLPPPPPQFWNANQAPLVHPVMGGVERGFQGVGGTRVKEHPWATPFLLPVESVTVKFLRK
ncbi:hypothetical protein HDU98_000488 [Podochytrium sp. JEL0797]|nr:hypothetical protein HDU98_000488 [Podochytrium sp. JEL0797]